MPYVKVHETWEDQPTETTPVDAAALMQIEAGIAAAMAAAEAGIPGDQGEEGPSAYDVAVAEGFEGDEAAWLASLVGPEGSGNVSSSGTPAAGEYPRWTDESTIEALTKAELLAALDLEAGTDFLSPSAVTTAITDAVNDLLDGAPAALDTLNKLAAAVNDDASFAATVTTALAGKQATHANLTALAGLTLIADRLPYANGSGTLTLATLTAAGRALLDDANAAAQLSTLGISAFAQTILDDANAGAVRTTIGAAAAGTIVIPEVRTYVWPGAFTTSTVFPPFHVDESVGTLVLTKVRTKLTSGTATVKLRIQGVDEVTGISVSSTDTTNDFADEGLANLDRIDIVATAASTPVDLSMSFFFERTITLA